MGIIEDVTKGETRALARVIRAIDDGAPEARGWLKELFPHTGRALVLGVTGPPGAGKSTLTDRLIGHYRTRGVKVGVLAVDPTSPFSGGAILGDRVRMQRHAADSGVFIRSLATRGQFGGLSLATGGAVFALDAAGYEVIIIETVGVGQDEVDVARIAHTTIIVTVPGLGDDIQAIKAGLLEVADVFVVNKADMPGAERTVRDLEQMLQLTADAGWRPPIVKTVAARGQGVEELAAAVEAHGSWRSKLDSKEIHDIERKRAILLLTGLVKEMVWEQVNARLGGAGGLEKAAVDLAQRRADPYTLAEGLVSRALK